MNLHWWAADYYTAFGPAFLAAWCVWVVISICLHELAHGYASIALGDRTPIETGHMTWNPLVHMGTTGLLLFAVMGISCGSMPIDPQRIRGRHGDAIVSAAGPIMNVVLWIICILAGAIAIKYGADPWAPMLKSAGPLGLNRTISNATIADKLAMFCFVGAALNLSLAAFNLLPAPPLDGSRIAASFSRGFRDLMDSPNGQLTGLTIFVVFAVFLSQPLFEWCTLSSMHALQAVSGWI